MKLPYFNQYLGVWALREEEVQAHLAWWHGVDLHLHLQSQQAAEAQSKGSGVELDVRDGIAVIGLYGTLMKQTSSMSRNTSTVLARRQIRAAVADGGVTGILLHIESPGGTAAGSQELADDIFEANKKKPVYAFVEDLGASAAYFAASQARKVFANGPALVGSIGTYAVVHDLSGMAAKEGIRVHVVKAGSHKGAGVPGTEVTAEHLAEFQSMVNGINGFFLRAVERGRRMSAARVAELADGRIHLAEQAKALGLIDGVATLDQVFGELVALGRKSKGDGKMHVEMGAVVGAEQTTGQQAAAIQAIAEPLKPQAATYEELSAACIGADNDFICTQLKAKATLEQARSNWMAELVNRNNAAQAKAKAAEEQAAAAAKRPGVQPITSTGKAPEPVAGFEGDPIEAWESEMSKLVSAGMTKQRALSVLTAKKPELHTAYVAAYNELHDRKAAANKFREDRAA